MDIHDKITPNDLLEKFEDNLYQKVSFEVQNYQALRAKNPQSLEYFNQFEYYTEKSIENLHDIQDLHDVNLSFKALQIYHTNELEQATTQHEKNVEKSSLSALDECKGKLSDVQNYKEYATHYNSKKIEFYKTGLPKDAVTKTLHTELEKINNKTENNKGNISNEDFYNKLTEFTKNFQKDYQQHQEKSLVYHQAKESGLVSSFEKDSSKEFNSKYPHLKPFGEAIKELEDKLDKSNADDDTKFAVNKVNREKFLDKYIDKVAETNIERKSKELQKDNQPQQTQQLQQVQQQAPQEQTVKPANDDIEL